MIYLAIGSLIILCGVVFTLTFTLSVRVLYYSTLKIDPIKAITPPKIKGLLIKKIEEANTRDLMDEVS